MEHIENMVSVIIPVYNREKYIEACLQSVFAQTYQNFEIIIVDDGSADNSYKICQEYAEKDPRVKVFAGEHGGVSAARNTALSKAQGEYAFFLDSDDVIHPLLFEVLVAAMKEHSAQISGTDVVNVPQEKWGQLREKLADAKSDEGKTVFLPHEKALAATMNGQSPLRCVGGVMISRELIGQTQFRTDLFIGEDFYFVYENLIKGASAIFLRQKWYYVRIHENNSSWDWSYNGFWTRFYRRKLVWEKEESFGRKQNAAMQKSSAFGIFLMCIAKNKPYSTDAVKMRKVLKAHKKDIFPALSRLRKMLYLISCYCPIVTKILTAKKTNAKKKSI